ncbi:MAG: hypothetical protein IKY83_05050 [Proteobacteria bacterium]|nr:hypothetical protein [Pseudomonadota bacterium]
MKPYICMIAGACLGLSVMACQPRQEASQDPAGASSAEAVAVASGASGAENGGGAAPDAAAQPGNGAAQEAAAEAAPETVSEAEKELDALLDAYRPHFRPVVIYFSHTGHTRYVAEYIQKATDADIFEIKPLEPYPEDHDAVLARAKKELDEKALPAIAELPDEITSLKPPKLRMYSVVYLGFPNWYGTIPRPVFTMIASGLFYGKAVAPFVTHGGGGMQNIETDLKEAMETSKVLKGLLIRDKNVQNSQKEIDRWLSTIVNRGR